MNYKCLIAYDGSLFLGWQKTPNGPTVEGAVEEALSRLLGKKPKIQAASRTDRGVHARGQVINFSLEKEWDTAALKRRLNALLQGQVIVRELCEEKSTFHPTLDAKGKRYEYYVCNAAMQSPFLKSTSWHYPYVKIDLSLARKGAEALVGTRDFSAFTLEDVEDGVRTLTSLSITPLEGQRFHFKVEGDNFLYRMVRTLVGTLVYVGGGFISPDAIPKILKSKKRKRAGVTAPAHGLFLDEIFY